MTAAEQAGSPARHFRTDLIAIWVILKKKNLGICAMCLGNDVHACVRFELCPIYHSCVQHMSYQLYSSF